MTHDLLRQQEGTGANYETQRPSLPLDTNVDGFDGGFFCGAYLGACFLFLYPESPCTYVSVPRDRELCMMFCNVLNVFKRHGDVKPASL